MRAPSKLLVLTGLLLSSTAMAAEYAGTLSTVPLDVDVYDQPGGEGKKHSQFLKGGSQVYLVSEDNDWCKVAGDAVPGTVGWIWCGMGDDGQNYALTPVAGGGMIEVPPDPGAGGGGGGGTGGVDHQ